MATGDQTLINFPRESTMKEISQALQTMAFIQAANWKTYQRGTRSADFPEMGTLRKFLISETRFLRNGQILPSARNMISRGRLHILKM